MDRIDQSNASYLFWIKSIPKRIFKYPIMFTENIHKKHSK